MKKISNLRIDPIAAVCRVYPDKVDTSIPLQDEHQPYSGSFVLLFSDNGKVRIQGLNTEISLSNQRDLFKQLKEAGYSEIEWRHKGKSINRKL